MDTIGIKWIASFPDNVKRGLPRASAVLILSDYITGYPFACLEAAGISAARTAASAAIAAGLVVAPGPVRVAFVGAGVIARTILDYVHARDVAIADILVHDLDAASAAHLTRYAASRHGVPASVGPLDEALTRELVIFATTATAPYVPTGTTLRPGQVLLNISLRDFITGTLGALLRGDVTLDRGKPVIFSPFGLGILDLAVGLHVLREARRQGSAIDVPDFIGETERW